MYKKCKMKNKFKNKMKVYKIRAEQKRLHCSEPAATMSNWH